LSPADHFHAKRAEIGKQSGCFLCCSDFRRQYHLIAHQVVYFPGGAAEGKVMEDMAGMEDSAGSQFRSQP
jgi:hypothetical protein